MGNRNSLGQALESVGAKVNPATFAKRQGEISRLVSAGYFSKDQGDSAFLKLQASLSFDEESLIAETGKIVRDYLNPEEEKSEGKTRVSFRMQIREAIRVGSD